MSRKISTEIEKISTGFKVANRVEKKSLFDAWGRKNKEDEKENRIGAPPG